MAKQLLRQQKINLLQGLLEGKALSRLLPVINVTLIEHEPGMYIALTSGGKLDMENSRASAGKEEEFFRKVQIENPSSIITQSIIGYEQFLIIDAQLESEY